ncbi:MAG TPA: aminomethyltransferase family protein, partial [Thermoleophilia bacterium]|nr:aminomethyltransferase family protein [Thermoleophilia bacterium]
MLRQTPFHPRTAALCEGLNWRRWAGYVVASSYELQHDREYHAIRTAAAMLDISPLYKYLVTGPDAATLLDRVVTRDVSRCQVGQVLYTPWCDSKGKQIDDGTLARLAESVFRLTAAEPNLRWLHLNATGLDVTIADVSDTVAALAVQGPASRVVLEHAADTDLAGLRFFRLTNATIRGIPVTISRTGYTGDLGYEIWLEAGQALPLWDELINAGTPYGLTPAGILALDVARIEAGLLLLDVDYVPANRALIEDQKSSPFELKLGWTVALDKPAFVGRAALVAEAAREPTWRLAGIEVDWTSLERLHADRGLPPKLPAVAFRTSVPLYVEEEQVGYAT